MARTPSPEKTADLEAQFEDALASIPWPETPGKNLLQAKAVSACVVNAGQVVVRVRAPQASAQHERLARQIQRRLRKIKGVQKVLVRFEGVELPTTTNGTAQPPLEGSQPRRPERTALLQNYQAIVVVGSGKGGVGKSTVSINLAVALQKMGLKVSLFDADIYGPSAPIMLGVRGKKPQIEGEKTILPIVQHGISMLSLGNLVDEAAAAIWRGPIVHQVLEQLLRDTAWPGGDVMVIDLPPGTGDVQLTLSQLLEISGAVIVSTPQDVALLDAIKAIAMFEKVDVPVLGMVENMSGFVCPQCGEETAIFNENTTVQACQERGMTFLGTAPLHLAIRESGDAGVPICVAQPGHLASVAYTNIAQALLKTMQ